MATADPTITMAAPVLLHENEDIMLASDSKPEYTHSENGRDNQVGRAELYSAYEAGGIIETAKKFKYASLICFLAAVSAMTDGYQVSINGSIIANAGFVNDFATQVDSTGSKSLAASTLLGWGNIFTVGQILGLTCFTFVADLFGRKACMYSYWAILALSVALESASSSIAMWYPAKLFAGLGVGAMQMCLPTYICEVAPVRIRGMLLFLYNFWWSVGSFLSPVILYVCSNNNPLDWKTPVYSQWAHVGMMLLIYVFLPESPHWCAARGKDDYGKKMLARINGGVQGYDIEAEYHRITLTIAEERRLAKEAKQESFWAIFKGSNGLRTAISGFTLLAQGFTGAGVFYTYLAYFFSIAGVDDPFLCTIITNVVNLCTILVCIAFTDRIGRRIICCGGITLCWISLFPIGAMGMSPLTSVTKNLLVLFACVFTVGLQSSGSAGFAYLGETASSRLRAKTAGFSLGCTASIGLGLGSSLPYMLNKNNLNWGLKTCFFYAGIGAPFAIGSWFLMPETSGRSPAELDELFETKVKPWRFHKTQTSIEKEGQEALGIEGRIGHRGGV